VRLWKSAGRQDREAARAGAQIQDASRRNAQILEEERDVRPRNDYAAIHIEGKPVQPRLVEQVGGRNALLYSFLDQRLDAPRIGVPAQVFIGRHTKPAQHQERGFIARIAGAVPVVKPRCLESPCDFLDQLL